MATEDKLIDYLSKEIETQTKSLMTFRERINFAVFIGPFVLLGATLYGNGIVPRINWSGVSRGSWLGLGISFLGVILSYLTMGIACALIEKHMWKQCNTWRTLIAEIIRGCDSGLTADQIGFEEHLIKGYLWVYFAMVIAFGSAITFVLILQAQTMPTSK